MPSIVLVLIIFPSPAIALAEEGLVAGAGVVVGEEVVSGVVVFNAGVAGTAGSAGDAGALISHHPMPAIISTIIISPIIAFVFMRPL
jgi:hypothetical protein